MGGANVDTFGAFTFLAFSIFTLAFLYSLPEIQADITNAINQGTTTPSYGTVAVLQPLAHKGPYYSPYTNENVNTVFEACEYVLRLIKERAAANTLGATLQTLTDPDPTIEVYKITPLLSGSNLFNPIALYVGACNTDGSNLELCGPSTSTTIRFRNGPVGSPTRLFEMTSDMNLYQTKTGAATTKIKVTTAAGMQCSISAPTALGSSLVTTYAFELTDTALALGPYYDYRGNALKNGFVFKNNGENSVAALSPGSILYALRSAAVLDLAMQFERVSTKSVLYQSKNFVQNVYRFANRDHAKYTNVRLTFTNYRDAALIIPPGVPVAAPVNAIWYVSSIDVETFGTLSPIQSIDFVPAAIGTITFNFANGATLTLDPWRYNQLYNWYYKAQPGLLPSYTGYYIFGVLLDFFVTAPAQSYIDTPTFPDSGIFKTLPTFSTYSGISFEPTLQWSERLVNNAAVKNDCPYVPSQLQPFWPGGTTSFIVFGVILVLLIALACYVWLKPFPSDHLQKSRYLFRAFKFAIPAVLGIWILGLAGSYASEHTYNEFAQSSKLLLFICLAITLALVLFGAIAILRFDSTMLPTPILCAMAMITVLMFLAVSMNTETVQVAYLSDSLLITLISFGILAGSISYMALNALELRFTLPALTDEAIPTPLMGTGFLWFLTFICLILLAFSAVIVNDFTQCSGTTDQIESLEAIAKTSTEKQLVSKYQQEIQPAQSVCTIEQVEGGGEALVAIIVTSIIFFCIMLYSMSGYMSDALGLKDYSMKNIKEHLHYDEIKENTWMPFIFGSVMLAAVSTASVFVIFDARDRKATDGTCAQKTFFNQTQLFTNYKPSLEQANAITIQSQRSTAASCSNDAEIAAVIVVSILLFLFFILPMIKSDPSMKMQKVTQTGYAFIFFSAIICLYLATVSYENAKFVQQLPCRI